MPLSSNFWILPIPLYQEPSNIQTPLKFFLLGIYIWAANEVKNSCGSLGFPACKASLIQWYPTCSLLCGGWTMATTLSDGGRLDWFCLCNCSMGIITSRELQLQSRLIQWMKILNHVPVRLINIPRIEAHAQMILQGAVSWRAVIIVISTMDITMSLYTMLVSQFDACKLRNYVNPAS